MVGILEQQRNCCWKNWQKHTEQSRQREGRGPGERMDCDPTYIGTYVCTGVLTQASPTSAPRFMADETEAGEDMSW